MYGKVPLTPEASCMVANDRVDATAYLFGYAEIENFDQTVRGYDDIRRLQISMNDTTVMSAGECAGNLNTVSQD